MFFKKIYILVLLLFPFTPVVFSQQLVVKSPVRFLALGDSYTIGQGVAATDSWPNQFIETLKNRGMEIEKITIIAQTGWRTNNLLEAISIQKPDPTYSMVSLLIGVNNQYQGMNIDVYAVEFRKLLEKATALCGGQKDGVFVLSVPDYGFTPFGLAGREKISVEIDQYNQINRKIAREIGIAYFDITPISREAIDKPEYVASDNLHPSGIMYAKWIELIVNSSSLETIASNIFEYQNSIKTEVYPNPASSSIKIRAPQKGNKIVIYSSQGSIVWQSVKLTVEEFKIDVSGWRNGMYYYQIKQNNKTYFSGKLLIE